MTTKEQLNLAWNRRRLRLALTFALVPLAILATAHLVREMLRP